MRVAIVGSGPAGTAAATALLELGCAVTMVDVGLRPPPAAQALAHDLAATLQSRGRPRWSTLRAMRSGARFGRKRFFGSDHAYADEGGIVGPSLPRSAALGGLSNVWGAACYPMAPDEFGAWPIGAADLAPFYARTAGLLSIDQGIDNLADAYPIYGTVRADVARNSASAMEPLLQRWRIAGQELSQGGIHAGRSRLAVAFTGPRACTRCGTCLWGCPSGSIYTSATTVDALLGTAVFKYLGNHRVIRFARSAGGTIELEAIAGESLVKLVGFDRVVLAAGAVESFRIAAQALAGTGAETTLLDNDMLVVPMVSAVAARDAGARHQFALSEAAIRLDAGSLSERVHVQLYAPHPYFFGRIGDALDAAPRAVRAAFGHATGRFALAFVYRSSDGSTKARLVLAKDGKLAIHLQDGGKHTFAPALQRLAASAELGLRAMPFARYHAPFGGSGHLAGTLPMRSSPKALETDALGRLGGCPEVVVADAASFPTLVPQNPTMTVVANALRVAAAAVHHPAGQEREI